MLAVLDLHPMLRLAALVGPIAALGDQSFKAYPARAPKDTLKRVDEDALGAVCQSRSRLALRIDSGKLRRSSPSIASAAPHFLVVSGGMERVKIRGGVNPQDDSLAVATPTARPALSRKSLTVQAAFVHTKVNQEERSRPQWIIWIFTRSCGEFATLKLFR